MASPYKSTPGMVRESPSPPSNTHARRRMNPRSGLTYIIVNKETKLVLDDPVSEGGYVNVSHLNKDDTQKV